MRLRRWMVEKRWAITMVLRPAIRLARPCWHQTLILRVQSTRRLIQQQQRRIAQDRTRDGDALALPAGQSRPALADSV